MWLEKPPNAGAGAIRQSQASLIGSSQWPDHLPSCQSPPFPPDGLSLQSPSFLPTSVLESRVDDLTSTKQTDAAQAEPH